MTTGFGLPQDGCIGYLGHPFKKDGLHLLDHSCSLDMEPDGGTGDSVLLTEWREEVSIKQAQRRRSSSTRSRKPPGCRTSSLRSADSGHMMTRRRTSTHS